MDVQGNGFTNYPPFAHNRSPLFSKTLVPQLQSLQKPSQWEYQVDYQSERGLWAITCVLGITSNKGWDNQQLKMLL